MMLILNLLMLWLQILTVNMRQHEKPVTELKWSGKCLANSRVLNDCNWCRCNARSEYTCDARVCGLVDMWGHFNDTIQEFDPGMEGHGVWRTTKSACEPQVSYRRGGLLCVCNEDGNWPNPVCRDVFRILHEVEVTRLSKANGEDCAPYKLYLVGCNVCFCSSDGRLDSQLCTNRKCTRNDPVMRDKEVLADVDENAESKAVEIYADCQPDLKYKMGCKECTCLRNNRLLCKKCKDVISTLEKSTDPVVLDIVPIHQKGPKCPKGLSYKIDCNYCFCLSNGNALCTTVNCDKTSING